MESLQARLLELVRKTCGESPGSPGRQKGLTQIIRLIGPHLWKDPSPDYPDALQKTWIYFCQNLCEGITGRPYDPEYASPITWLNAYLKRRLQDARIAAGENQARFVSIDQPLSQGELDIILSDQLSAQPDIPPILERVRQWAEADLTHELRQVYIQGHPEITCQNLILRRLPPETSWQALATEFGVSVGTLSSFYQRQCLSRLRKFGETEGFL